MKLGTRNSKTLTPQLLPFYFCLDYDACVQSIQFATNQVQMSQSETAVEELAGRPLTTLSEDEQMFRASVREFAEGELRPRVEEMDEKGSSSSVSNLG